MLKITIEDSARRLTLRLEGRLAGPWVEELRHCWLAAATTTAGRETWVDLCEVDFVDPYAKPLLAEMTAAGVHMAACTPLIRAVVDEITGCDSVRDNPAPESHAVLRPHTSGRRSSAL